MLRVLSLEGHSFNLLFPPFPHLHFRLRAFAGIHDPVPFRLFLFFVFFVSRLSDPDFSRLRTHVRPSLIARIRNMCLLHRATPILGAWSHNMKLESQKRLREARAGHVHNKTL